MTDPSPEWQWHLTETYKALITLAVEALKMLALVNGGAAIAVLTYLGNLASRAAPGQMMPDVIPALRWYCAGLAVTVLAVGAAYVAQSRLDTEEIKKREGVKVRQRHILGVWLGVLLALFSVAAFATGSLKAASALGALR